MCLIYKKLIYRQKDFQPSSYFFIFVSHANSKFDGGFVGKHVIGDFACNPPF